MLCKVRKIPTKSSELMRFKCSGCGNCCNGTVVAITHKDIKRLAKHTGKSPLALSQLYTPEEVNCPEDDPMWVQLRYGLRMVALKRDEFETCRFLDEENRCSVYPARPQACRSFPLQFIEHRNAKKGITIQDSAKGRYIRCRGYFTGENRGAERREQLHLEEQETDAYRDLLDRWGASLQERTKKELFRYLKLI